MIILVFDYCKKYFALLMGKQPVSEVSEAITLI